MVPGCVKGSFGVVFIVYLIVSGSNGGDFGIALNENGKNLIAGDYLIATPCYHEIHCIRILIEY